MSELTLHEPGGDVVAPTDPTGGRLVAWAKAASAAHSLAKALSQTAFVPKQFQGNAAEATAAIILGDELGLSPISALRSIYVINGQPALYARTMVALVLAHGHRIWTVEDTPQRVTVAGQRRGSEHVEKVTWTLDRATKAGYTSNRKYASDPVSMLWARAAGDVARRIAPDVLAGVPATVEEIELDTPSTTTVVRAGDEKPRTVSRRKPEPAPEPEEPPLEEEPQELAPQPGKPPEDPITPAQQRALHATLRDAGAGDREAGLDVISSILGRRVESTKTLSRDEASQVIDALKQPEPEADEPELWPAMAEPGGEDR